MRWIISGRVLGLRGEWVRFVKCKQIFICLFRSDFLNIFSGYLMALCTLLPSSTCWWGSRGRSVTAWSASSSSRTSPWGPRPTCSSSRLPVPTSRPCWWASHSISLCTGASTPGNWGRWAAGWGPWCRRWRSTPRSSPSSPSPARGTWPSADLSTPTPWRDSKELARSSSWYAWSVLWPLFPLAFLPRSIMLGRLNLFCYTFV